MLLRRCFPAFLISLLLAVTAAAQTVLHWDVDGATPGLAMADGTWNLTTPHWSPSAAGDVATQGWDNGSIAWFDYNPGNRALWVDQNITVAGIHSDYNPNTFTLSGPGIITLQPGANLFLEGPGSTSFVIDTVLAGTGGFVKTGENALILNGNNTYTGQTLLEDGDLYVGHANALGASGVGNETVINASFFSGVRFESSITTAESFIFENNGIISAYNENGLDVVLSGGIRLNDRGWLMGSASANSSLAVNGVISEGSGPQDLHVADVTLNGANTFTGRVVVDGGVLTVAQFNNDFAPGALGQGAGLDLGYEGEGTSSGAVVYTGASVSSNRSIYLVGDAGEIGVAGSSTALTLTGVIADGSDPDTDHDLVKSGPGALVLRGNNTYTGDTYLTNGALIIGHNNALGTAPALLRIGGANTSSSSTLQLALEGGITLARNIDILDGNDSGLTTLSVGSGTATFSGTIFLERNINVSVPSAAELRFTGLVHDDINLDPIITKTGAGRAVFSGGVDLALGGFTVQQGELRLNATNSLAYGVAVQNGATLSGTGTINTGPGYAVVLQGGGILQPGSQGTGGTITFGNFEMMASSRIGWELLSLSTTPGTFDRVVVNTGGGQSLAIATGAALTVDLSLLAISQRPLNGNALLNDPFWQTVQTWQVVDFTGSGTNTLSPGMLNPLSVTNPLAYAGGAFDTFVGGGSGEFAAFSSGDVYLRFTPVPEPSTYLLLALGGALLAWRRRQ